MAHVALYTADVLTESWEHDVIAGFLNRIPIVFDAARAARGIISIPNGYDDPTVWCMPSYLDPSGHDRFTNTLSVWADLEAVFAFAYGGLHAEALQHRSEWFAPKGYPVYGVWWIPDGHIPTWAEAANRITSLHDRGPTPYCFNFHTAFDADEQPTKVDRVRALASRLPVPKAVPV